MRHVFVMVAFLLLLFAVACDEGTEEAKKDAGVQAISITPADSGKATDDKPAGESPVATEEPEADDTEEPTDDALVADEELADEDTDEEPVIEEPAAEPAADVTTIVLETTKGDIVMELHSDWSPLGVAHFIELVKDGFYDGAPWFRVMDGFMCQCGVAADPAMNTKWSAKTIMDEEVVMGNKPGYVAFGKTRAPNSRSSHFFINYEDNGSKLDYQGFSCFALVTEGLDVAKSLEILEYRDQGGLGLPGGLDTFKKAFPNADYIKKAYIKE